MCPKARNSCQLETIQKPQISENQPSTLEPENDGLIQMIFLLQGARILRFHVDLPGCTKMNQFTIFRVPVNK